MGFRALPAHSREDESVTVEPLGVLGVELHDPVEKNVGNGCHAPICSCQQTLARSRHFTPRC